MTFDIMSSYGNKLSALTHNKHVSQEALSVVPPNLAVAAAS